MLDMFTTKIPEFQKSAGSASTPTGLPGDGVLQSICPLSQGITMGVSVGVIVGCAVFDVGWFDGC